MLIISTAIVLTLSAGVLSVVNPVSSIFTTQPEVADLQQRLRSGVDVLKGDLRMAGAGAYAGPLAGTLNNFFASVQPARDDEYHRLSYFHPLVLQTVSQCFPYEVAKLVTLYK